MESSIASSRRKLLVGPWLNVTSSQKHLVILTGKNDLIIFCSAKEKSVGILMEAFQRFSATTRLEANQSKSMMVFAGVDRSIRLKILQQTGFEEGQFPIKYLGISITAGMLSKNKCRLLVDKIAVRIQTWTSRHLSYTGRVTLINSVLIGLYSFWASIFLIPQEVINQITAKCRNFLWGAIDSFKKIPYVTWENTCRPKTYGGHRDKKSEVVNEAYIRKLIWVVAIKKDNMWVKWVRGRYIKGKEWWSYTPHKNVSWYWRKVCQTKEFFKWGSSPIQK